MRRVAGRLQDMVFALVSHFNLQLLKFRGRVFNTILRNTYFCSGDLAGYFYKSDSYNNLFEMFCELTVLSRMSVCCVLACLCVTIISVSAQEFAFVIGCWLFHPSWHMCIYKRMFESENKTLTKEGILHFLELYETKHLPNSLGFSEVRVLTVTCQNKWMF